MAQFLASSRYIPTTYTLNGATYPSAVRVETAATRVYSYTCKDGDSFDRIAGTTLGDPMRYWEIADLNPHVPFPDTIPLGTVIRIPSA